MSKKNLSPKTAKSCMTMNMLFVNSNDSFKQAIIKLADSSNGIIPVKENNKTIGFFNYSDALKTVVSENYPSGNVVENYISKKVVAVKSGAYIYDAMNLMIKNEVKILVILEKGIETGYLTFEDLLLEVQCELNLYFEDLKSMVKSRSDEIDRLLSLKEEYLTIAAHDLKSPLSVIVSFTDLLFEDTSLTEEQKFCLNYIKSQTEEMISMVNNILMSAKIDSGSMMLNKSEFIFNELLNNVKIGFTIITSKKGIEFEYFCDDNIKYIGDSLKIKEAIVNLLDNAFKYTEKGKVSFICKKSGDGVEIIISDTGFGFNTEELEHVFEKYATVVRKRSTGTGLGMYIASEIIKLHGGYIELKSKPDEGSIFTILLPSSG